MEGYAVGIDSIRDGMTEKELAAVIESKWLELGSSTPLNLNLAATWRSVRFAHVEPADTPIQKGEIVNMDGGCTVDGYRADIFRMACIGRPADRREEPMIRCMIDAQRAAIAVIKPGVTCGEVWAKAAEVLDEGGFGHLLADTSIGHSIGLEMHELPHLARDSSQVIEENMVLCVEPWLLDYSDWSLGRNYEDMVRVTADGTELLSPGFDELIIV
jgi:Xaa-Pro aminopeptidase